MDTKTYSQKNFQRGYLLKDKSNIASTFLVTETPQKKNLCSLSKTELAELRKQLEKLFDQRFIGPSTSSWGASVLFASKKDGSFLSCIGHRALKKLTIKNRSLLPQFDYIFDQLYHAKKLFYNSPENGIPTNSNGPRL